MTNQAPASANCAPGLRSVITNELADFLEAAAAHPRSVIVFRAAVPPSAAELRQYAIALGGVLPYEPSSEVRTLRYDQTIADSIAMSAAPLPLHTDGSFLANPPSRFMLSCHDADHGGGGVNTFISNEQILAAAPDWVLHALSNADYLFLRTYNGDLTDSYIGPVLYQLAGETQIRWRSDHLNRPHVINDRGTAAAAAVDWLHEFLTFTQPATFAAEAGDTILVPNTLMVHGRTGLSVGSTRHVLRVWII